jgi:site-specific DNA recombinase
MTVQTPTRRAAIYGRQSKADPNGITRQLKLTKALIRARGWTLVETYVDDDVSASKARGKGTAWARMLADRAAGLIDVVVAVDLDRLLRTTKDLNTLIDAGLMAVTVDGELDLSTADGEFRATMLAGIARFEVRRKGERQKRGNEQRATTGEPVYRARRFGYLGSDKATGRPANVVAHPQEAQLIREAAATILAGGSLGTVTRTWQEVATTVYGGRWSRSAVKNILSNPYLAGIAYYKGEPVNKPGKWEAILDVDTHKALVTLFDRRVTGSRQGAPVRALLTNIARCGKCGSFVHGIRDGQGNPKYRCSAVAHVVRAREPIDKLVRGAVIALLERPDAARLVRDESRMERLAAVRAQSGVVRARLDNIALMMGAGEFTREQAATASAAARAELAELDAEHDTLTRGSVLAGLAGAPDAAARWDGLDIDRQRDIISALFDVTINGWVPGTSTKVFDPASVILTPHKV